jgi:hypothetical protein
MYFEPISNTKHVPAGPLANQSVPLKKVAATYGILSRSKRKAAGVVQDLF